MAPNSMVGEAGPSKCVVKTKNHEGKKLETFEIKNVNCC